MSSESYRSVPVLVVDDDPDLLTAIAATLEPEGFVVTVCSSPVQALALMDSGGYGLVIADNYMPGMTGLQLLACVRERWPHVTRVLITGLLAIDTLITAINSGEIYRFIAKNDMERWPGMRRTVCSRRSTCWPSSYRTQRWRAPASWALR